MYQSDFLRAMEARGFLDNCTDFEGLDALMLRESVPAYIGFDCTAPSLHAGSLVQLMILRWLQKTGHRPIVLMGGGTTKIGDPSGKDSARQMLTEEQIADNLKGIRRIFDRFVTFDDGPNGAVMANNADWLEKLDYIDFLRDIGRHFSVARMLSFESVQRRLKAQESLSFLEFNYMVLQAYDFVELARRHGCRMQAGGSDQWGNIVNGIELGRRLDGLRLYGITSPLLTTSSGAKMGKTASGAVWLDSERLSAFDFWQYWRNADDADIGRFLRLFTELSLDEVERLERLQGTELNAAKSMLASSVTALVHGEEVAQSAARAAAGIFADGDGGGELPTVELEAHELDTPLPLPALFVKAGLAGSSKEAKRLIRDGAARINGRTAADPARQIARADLVDGPLRLSAGRKRHALVCMLESSDG